MSLIWNSRNTCLSKTIHPAMWLIRVQKCCNKHSLWYLNGLWSIWRGFSLHIRTLIIVQLAIKRFSPSVLWRHLWLLPFFVTLSNTPSLRHVFFERPLRLQLCTGLYIQVGNTWRQNGRLNQKPRQVSSENWDASWLSGYEKKWFNSLLALSPEFLGQIAPIIITMIIFVLPISI